MTENPYEPSLVSRESISSRAIKMLRAPIAAVVIVASFASGYMTGYIARIREIGDVYFRTQERVDSGEMHPDAMNAKYHRRAASSQPAE